MLALINRERQRLLTVHIFFGVGRRDVDERMPVIRRRLHDDVDVIPLQQLSKIAIFRGRFAILRKFLRGLIRILLIHVADRQNVAEA